ncbi:type I DNA topoisomerase [Bartonella sp. DGB1]|uniref:type I DNA topoisomerase n=1 Tax=Bartonella sp. DGB1 TaxID=3239807 RepID=UPI00352325FE
MKLVVVESPAKAKTIHKYLGNDYKVLASFGHIRDLPSKNGSVLPEDNFSMIWEIDSSSKTRITEIKNALKDADTLILATDPDREGEAISWHIIEVLSDKKLLKGKKIQRVVFNAITKQSIQQAIANPRDIDQNLVDAYLARRALDYLVGFNLSPILWRKLPGARSAGRVQSVALRLVHDRETEIENFKSEEYWDIQAELQTNEKENFLARLVEFNQQKIEKLTIQNQSQAESLKNFLMNADYKVVDIEAKPIQRHPAPPFTTSTLQQAASSKFGFSPSKTMTIAQKLYEGIDIGGETTGLITYMRTDGIQITPEILPTIRDTINKCFGSAYVPEKPRFYANKAKNTQEAHEAIRPTDINQLPKDIKSYLDNDQAKLYELIWQRTIASQMNSAIIDRTTIQISAIAENKEAKLRSVGSVQKFDGFLSVYSDIKTSNDNEEESKKLPLLKKDQLLALQDILTQQHHTEPPPRYSEASLIKKLEEIGLGRPSTYATILATLRDRNYVTIENKRLIPQAQGRLVTIFLANFFSRYVEYDFTASLEEKLDLISDGKYKWKELLNDFWQDFSEAIDKTQKLRITNVLDILNEKLSTLIFTPTEDNPDGRKCPKCANGQLSLKTSKFGAFIGCSNYPDCNYTKKFLGDNDANNNEATEDKSLGNDPISGEEITLRNGRFGPYVQLGEGKTAKKTSIPLIWQNQELSLERALNLLSLPKTIGIHPETGKEIIANFGRFGPYILHDGKYTKLNDIEDIFKSDLEQILSLMAQPPEANKTTSRAKSEPLKQLGSHPDGGEINVLSGRFGPYIKWGKLNVTIPKTIEIADISFEEAIELIKNKQAKLGNDKKKPVKKTTAKAKTTRKTKK